MNTSGKMGALALAISAALTGCMSKAEEEERGGGTETVRAAIRQLDCENQQLNCTAEEQQRLRHLRVQERLDKAAAEQATRRQHQDAVLGYKQQALDEALSQWHFVSGHDGSRADKCMRATAVAYAYSDLENPEGYQKFTKIAEYLCSP